MGMHFSADKKMNSDTKDTMFDVDIVNFCLVEIESNVLCL
jgi:hypothetical protein